MREPKAPNPNLVLTVLLTGYLMIVLDLSIIFTGLPEIGRSMDLGPIALSWVHNAYLLCFGGFLLVAARLGDLFGRKCMLQAGIATFTVASLGVGCAQGPAMLIGARAFQGLGAAILAPSVLALLSTTFPEGHARSRALAWYSMVAGAGASLGLVLGGLFAGLLTWRLGFLINVPIGLLLLCATHNGIDETARRHGRADLVGAVTSTIGMGALIYGIVRSAKDGWADPGTLAAMALATCLLAGFLWHEARAAAPLLPLGLFRSKTRAAAYLGRMLFIGAAVAFFYFGTQLMQGALGFSPVQAGLGFLPMTMVTFAAALILPWFTARLGSAPVLAVAFLCMGLGLLWLSAAGAHARYLPDLALPMILIGIGNGAGLGPLTQFGVQDVRDEDQGAASGLVNAAHQLGGSLGLGILVVVFTGAALPGVPAAEGLAHQIGAVFAWAGAMCGIGLTLTVLFIHPAERQLRLA